MPRVKPFSFLAAILTLSLIGGFPYHALAQAGGSGTPKPAISPTELQPFLENFYFWMLALVGISALFMIVWGGVQYMISGTSITNASSARSKITNAIYGIILAAASVLILRTINPDLVTHGFDIKEIIDDAITEFGGSSSSNGGGSGGNGGGGGGNGGGGGGGGGGGISSCPPPCSRLRDPGLDLPVKDGACVGGISACEINSQVAQRLKALLNETSQRGLAWQVTEAYQPTLPQCGAGQTSGCHQNPCHWAATCVDANFTGGIQPNPANVKEFIDAANKAGLKAIYETTPAHRDTLIKGGVPAGNIQTPSNITAPHFSVYG